MADKKNKISVKQATDGSEGANFYNVIVTDQWNDVIVDKMIRTNERGNGLWEDERQTFGTSQFSAGRNPRSAIRRLFDRNYNPREY